MPRQRLLLDSNVLVRFFTGEPPAAAEKVYRLFERADRGEVNLIIFPVVVAETFFTLTSFYKLPRKETAQNLAAFLQSQVFDVVERDRLVDALKRCAEKNAHFVDAYLAAASLETGDSISSFDSDFKKFKDVERIEPS